MVRSIYIGRLWEDLVVGSGNRKISYLMITRVKALDTDVSINVRHGDLVVFRGDATREARHDIAKRLVLKKFCSLVCPEPQNITPYAASTTSFGV